MKRITYWPQFVLGERSAQMTDSVLTVQVGLAFNWGALLGPVAVLGYLDWATYIPLYCGSIAWTIFYDTIYAHQDKLDDVNVGVRSTALLFGEQTKPILATFGTAFVGLLSVGGWLNGQGLPFWICSVGGAAAHLAWQLRGVDLNSRESCWERFKANRDLGAIVWSGLVADYLIKVL